MPVECFVLVRFCFEDVQMLVLSTVFFCTKLDKYTTFSWILTESDHADLLAKAAY